MNQEQNTNRTIQNNVLKKGLKEETTESRQIKKEKLEKKRNTSSRHKVQN